ncbi:MAG: hypothetical protein ACPIOQ_30080, partial [Promethearchaeia archaeon]
MALSATLAIRTTVSSGAGAAPLHITPSMSMAVTGDRTEQMCATRMRLHTNLGPIICLEIALL